MTKTPKTIAANIKARKSTPKAKTADTIDWYAKAHSQISISKSQSLAKPVIAK
jgi:hypothetical protein